MNNPFVLEPYVPKNLFCDRKNELNLLLYYIKNRANVTLISPRRYGKTGLIFRTFDEIMDSTGSPTNKKIDCYYVDIYSSRNLEGFVSLLTEAVMKVLKKKSLIGKFLNVIGTVRPTLSYDPFTNSTQVSYTFVNDQQRKQTLKSILEFLEGQSHRVVIAIDEFQQIREYEDDVDMEALLRTYIQPLQNVHFIFCGSKKHVMVNMFTDATRPFYESTQCIYLAPIEHDVYKEFIRDMFLRGKKQITDDAIELVLEWTLSHTFYTQSLCYHLFMLGGKNIDVDDVYRTASVILAQQANTFMEQRNLLTVGQWKFLTAVAKETLLHQPTSSEFLHKYKLGSGSAAMRMLNALVDKEMILVENTTDGPVYRLYNVFLLRWLQRQ